MEKLEVWMRDCLAGILRETDEGYIFSYDDKYLESKDARPVSLTLPLRSGEYVSPFLFPFLDGLIPEGWLLDKASETWQIDRLNRFGLLSVACRDTVGAISIRKCRDVERPEDKRYGYDALSPVALTDDILDSLTVDTVLKGITVPGVQKKLPVPLFEGFEDYIIKPQVKEFRAMPEAECLVMDMSERLGIRTAEHALIPYYDGMLYIVKRMDRVIHADGNMEKLNMEDFCQLSGRLTADKYKSSYEQCGKVIRQYSSIPGADLIEFFIRVVFSFITGNSDMHLKNFSLLESEVGGTYALSPAYDLLPVNVIMPEDTEEMALTLNGKKRKLKRKDFIAFAENLKMSRSHAENLIDSLVRKKRILLKMVEKSHLPEDMKESFACLITDRISSLERI